MELGDDCLCSEPLDNDDAYAPLHDPSDSTAKECGAMEATRAGVGTSQLPVPFPAAATARRAFEIENDLGSNGKLVYSLPDPYDLSGKTLCVRHYALYGKDHDPPGNIKIARIGDPRGMAWQSSWGGAYDPDPRIGTPQVAVIADPGGIGNGIDCRLPEVGDVSRPVRFEDCQDHWCRFEICAEHDPRTGEHRVRARWNQVGGMRSHETAGNCGALPSTTSRIRGGKVEVLEYTTSAPPMSAGGSRFLSHAMLVVRSYDPDFWIGAACEVEGGCKPDSRGVRVRAD